MRGFERFMCKTVGQYLHGAMVAFLLLAAASLQAGPIPETGHFDGHRFFNPDMQQEHGFGDFWKWATTREQGDWEEVSGTKPGPPPPGRVNGDSLRVTFINHSTFLIQTRGLNILTDPTWSDRASPVSWAGPKRFRAPGIRFEDLPPIDLVLISHNHYDHLDLPTLKRLWKRDRPRIVVPLQNARTVAKAGFEEIRELDWWEGVEVADSVQVVCVPAQHFSSRTPFDRNLALWGGYVIESPGGPVYFAGDTGFAPFFEQIRERFGPMRLALLPIGAYKPTWFMGPVHIDPAEAVQAHHILDSQLTIGMHYGTFPLADDGQQEPILDLREVLGADSAAATSFLLLDFGEGRSVLPLAP